MKSGEVSSDLEEGAKMQNLFYKFDFLPATLTVRKCNRLSLIWEFTGHENLPRVINQLGGMRLCAKQGLAHLQGSHISKYGFEPGGSLSKFILKLNLAPI